MAELLHKDLSYKLQGHIFAVRKQYGPGLKENVYGNVLAELFEQDGIPFERERSVPIYSQQSGKVVGRYQPDFVIDGKLILELKASPKPSPQDERQLYSYLRNSRFEVGYLVNFSTPKLVMKRILYTNDRKPFLPGLGAALSCLFVFTFVLFGAHDVVQAQDSGGKVTTNPAVIDIEGLQRDIVQKEITVTNGTESTLHLYPTVRNVDPEGGVVPFTQLHSEETDRTTSLANWIELHRGQMVLAPGESKTVSVTVQIYLRATPGTYHAVIAFPPGNKREEAEARFATAAQTLVTVKVGEDAHEAASLLGFQAFSSLTGKGPITMTYKLENGGNRDVAPEGKILIYDRRGNEVAEVPVNDNGSVIPPEETVLMSSIWDTGFRAGRYKAFLAVDYGAGGKSIQDTTFFWVIPLPLLVTIFVVLIGGSAYVFNFWHRRYLSRHQVRIEMWHRRAAEVHAVAPQQPVKQRVRGLPHNPGAAPRNNVVDLRHRDDAEETRNKLQDTEKEQ